MALSLLIEHLKSYNVQQRRHRVPFAKLFTKIFRLSVLMLYRPVLVTSLTRNMDRLDSLSLLLVFQDGICDNSIRADFIIGAIAS